MDQVQRRAFRAVARAHGSKPVLGRRTGSDRGSQTHTTEARGRLSAKKLVDLTSRKVWRSTKCKDARFALSLALTTPNQCSRGVPATLLLLPYYI